MYSLEKQVSMELDYAINLRGLNGCKQYYVISKRKWTTILLPLGALIGQQVEELNWVEYI